VEFRILGPLEAWDGDRPVSLGGAKPRALLAVLLLHANQVVPGGRLVDELWGEEPPPAARNVVQSYVSRLRRVLGTGSVIVTRPQGYLLRVSDDALDRSRFEALLRAARRAADERVRATALHEALALWRGPALADVLATPTVVAEAARLDELRIVAVEERIEAELALGLHRELLGELRSLVSAYPLREGFRAQLMVALYRAGRQADALDAYREARRGFVEKLGIEPGRRLRLLERAILADDQSLELAPPARTAPVPAVPAQLPPDVEDFTGRDETLAWLDDLVRPAGSAAGVSTVAISGPAGVGKTALIVHAAHRLRQRFPDGQLWVSLGGASQRPLDPGQVLAQFLRAIGIEADTIPDDLAERSSRYRTALADRRVLVVLDDAASAAQVRPLLPAGAGCAVLVTGRRHLADIPGVSTAVLAVLAPEPAVNLLAKVAGPGRIRVEPSAADRIVRLCGYLPLAIRVAGAKLATREHWPLVRMAERLADERRRLSELHVGDLDIRATFELGHQALEPGDQRVFRLLGLVLAPDFPAWVAAALLDVDVAEAEERVDRLVDARFVEVAGRTPDGQTRYRLHDLLRLFAREQLEDEEPGPAREAALDRLLGAYLRLAARAAALLDGSDDVPGGQAATGAGPWLDLDPDGWLAAERASLVVAVEQASRQSRQAQVTWQLALTLSDFFERHSLWDDWRRTHELALEATRREGDAHAEALVLRRLGDRYLDACDWPKAQALFGASLPIVRELGDRQAEALVLRGLGDIYREQTRWQEALAYFDECLPIFQELGDRRGEAEILRGLGIIHRERGQLTESVACLERCLALSSELGDRRWEAIALRSLGMVYRSQRRFAEARDCFDASLAAFRELDDRRWEAYTCTSLALLTWGQGDLEEADGWLEQALAIFQEFDDRSGEAYGLQVLGDVRRGQGRLDEAAQCLQRCLALFCDLGDRRGEAYGRHSMGLLHQHEGRFEAAVGCFEAAVATFREYCLRPWEARALANLGRSLSSLGADDAAVETLQAALAVSEALDMPEASEVDELRRALLGSRAGLLHRASASAGPARPLADRAGPGTD